MIVVAVQIDRPPRLQWLLASPRSLAPDSHTDTSRPVLDYGTRGEKKKKKKRFYDATLEGRTEKQPKLQSSTFSVTERQKW